MVLATRGVSLGVVSVVVSLGIDPCFTFHEIQSPDSERFSSTRSSSGCSLMGFLTLSFNFLFVVLSQ
jgi:hypothetical protein